MREGFIDHAWRWRGCVGRTSSAKSGPGPATLLANTLLVCLLRCGLLGCLLVCFFVCLLLSVAINYLTLVTFPRCVHLNIHLCKHKNGFGDTRSGWVNIEADKLGGPGRVTQKRRLCALNGLGHGGWWATLLVIGWCGVIPGSCHRTQEAIFTLRWEHRKTSNQIGDSHWCSECA